jgi:hypothetical protein
MRIVGIDAARIGCGIRVAEQCRLVAGTACGERQIVEPLIEG